ncbi:MAG: carboxypeptidase regulatory-like domain-containing protein, partial [Cyanobacteria bacterium]|nr:carboxypeptidase regulatory-like domain-containing protein [Cyanobacteriota bacterium]
MKKFSSGVLPAVAVVLVCATLAVAQTQPRGEIFGRVTDSTGAVLPGALITISGPALLQPQTAVTSATGTYVFAQIPIGSYTVAIELSGFRSRVFEDVQVTIGFRAQINAQLDIATVQETLTVSGASPIVDMRQTGTQATFSQELLQSIPSSRDPWVMLERVPNIAMDRVNVGGSQSGQQSNYISRGAAGGNNKWTLDGVDITDMSATGASPIYYDFDMLQEMQVVTGGADVTQQTGGVGINFVTRGGTDLFRGSGRFYLTDDKFEADNVTPAITQQGAGSGAPIQNIKDFGFELGGPIKKGRLWYWGSYGKQDIKAGIVGFYLPTSTCQAIKSTPASYGTEDIRACLGTDGTKLDNYNWKLQWTPFTNNRLTFQNTWAAKTKNARDAGDTRPIETTFRQSYVPGKYGTYGWDVGPSPLYKAGDQHVISDRWLFETQWAHLGNNFILDFNQDALNDVQPRYNIDSTI